MKRLLALLLVFGLLLGILAGCGGKKADNSKKDSKEDSAPKGELFDAGNVQALVPEGWKAFPASDVFADDPDATDPDVISICKGGETELDLYTNPYIRFDYFGPDTQMAKPDKEWYTDPQDIEPFTTGSHTWQGFSSDEYGSTLVMLWAEEGEHQYQASLWLNVNGEEISLEDKDVLAILASVAPSGGSTPSGGSPSGTPAVTEAPENAADYWWWEGEWYGWWCICNAQGSYAAFEDWAWDAYATIEVDGDRGHIRIWDSVLAEFGTLINCDVQFVPGEGENGMMVSTGGHFFDSGADWECGGVYGVPAPLVENEWEVDPLLSDVSHFENMLEIHGYYTDPNNSANAFEYRIYLRPWGTDWTDVRTGDVSDCIYSDMMPVYYNEWYVPLLEKDTFLMPESFAEGKAILNEN